MDYWAFFSPFSYLQVSDQAGGNAKDKGKHERGASQAQEGPKIRRCGSGQCAHKRDAQGDSGADVPKVLPVEGELIIMSGSVASFIMVTSADPRCPNESLA